MTADPESSIDPDDPEDCGPPEVGIPRMMERVERDFKRRFQTRPPLRVVPDFDPDEDELDAYLRSDDFRQSFTRSGFGSGPLDAEGQSEQEEWIAARRTFEVMSTASLRRYVVKGVARTHRDTAKAILRERIERRNTRLKIAGAVALSLGGLGALAQAIAQFAA